MYGTFFGRRFELDSRCGIRLIGSKFMFFVVFHGDSKGEAAISLVTEQKKPVEHEPGTCRRSSSASIRIPTKIRPACGTRFLIDILGKDY